MQFGLSLNCDAQGLTPGRVGICCTPMVTPCLLIDFYEILGVAQTATADEIRNAYRARVQERHPDRNDGDSEAHEGMVILNQARDTLLDPGLRRQHDVDRLRERVRRARPQHGPSIHALEHALAGHLPVLDQPALEPTPSQPASRWGGLLLFGLGATGALLLAGKNDYDGNVRRYRDGRGRFHKRRFF